ncbi:MAG: riboflavin synthase [Hyphomicrobiales bacterium]|nr:riboflavin synthase [Hyphomicrobiales bacterium]
MFTGLITDVGEIRSIEPQGSGRQLIVACSYEADSISIGASIAHAGACLTVVAIGTGDDGRTTYAIDASIETVERTTMSEWQAGTKVNLERSLCLGDEMGGHLVTGHVDGVATIVERTDEDGCARFDIEAPPELARFIAEKGSVALDGTSLTVNSVDGNRFSILLIPHTLAVTTWGKRGTGDRINLEVDLMARYIARLREAE